MLNQNEINQKLLQTVYVNAPETIKNILSDTDIRLDIEPGWFDIIDKFLKKFNEINNVGIKIIQIKQKFGGLRIYIGYPDEMTNDVMSVALRVKTEVFIAEKEADVTCELCGVKNDSVSVRAPRFWRWNCCDKCFEKKCLELKVN